MTVARFWTNASSEIKIRDNNNERKKRIKGDGGGGATKGGRGGGGGWGGGLGGSKKNGGGPGSGSGASGKIPEVQHFDIATDFSGGQYATIETLNGVALSEFAFIYVAFDAAETVTDQALGMELSVDGSTWRNGASAYRESRWNAAVDAAYDTDVIELYSDGHSSWHVAVCISNIGVDAPTSVRSKEMRNGDLAPYTHVALSNTSSVDTAIRFFDTGGANWTTGKIRVIGVYYGEATVQSHDFGASPAVTHVFDIPEGHKVATILATGTLTTAASAQMQYRLGTSDVFLGGAGDYHGFKLKASASGTGDTNSLTCSDGGRTNHDGQLEIWGLNTVAPVTSIGASHQVDLSTPSLKQHITSAASPVSYDQIEVSNDVAASINAGVVYCISYAGDSDVALVDFTGNTQTTHEFHGLGDWPIVVLAVPTLTLSSNGQVWCHMSKDGIIFDNNTQDYRDVQLNYNFDSATNESWFRIGPGGLSTQHGFSTLFVGFGLNTFLHMVNSCRLKGASGSANCDGGLRLDVQSNVSLEIFQSNAGDFTGGKVYRVGFAL